jgi:hypothetical protein
VFGLVVGYVAGKRWPEFPDVDLLAAVAGVTLGQIAGYVWGALGRTAQHATKAVTMRREIKLERLRRELAAAKREPQLPSGGPTP